MENQVKIVPVEEGHIAQCVCIALKAGALLHAAFKNRLGAELDEKLHSAWREDAAVAAIRGLKTGNAFVALDGERTVGYACYDIRGIVGVIGENAVDPDYQDKGVAEKLYEAVLEVVRKAGCRYANVKTDLDESNAPTLDALKRLGFEKQQPGVRYYQMLDLEAEPYETQSEQVQVVPCEEKHVEDCVRIALIAWSAIHQSYKNCIGEKTHDDLMTGWEISLEKDVRKMCTEGKCYAALVDGKVAGFAAYRVNGDMGVLSRNAVDPQFRGRGIAKLMYGLCMNRIREAGCTWATVHTGLDDGHAGARRAYSKVGFEKNLPYTRFYMAL